MLHCKKVEWKHKLFSAFCHNVESVKAALIARNRRNRYTKR